MNIPDSIQRLLRTTARRVGSRDGFTLVEMMMAIVIATVVMAIAVPSLKALLRHHAPEELVSELHVAQMYAIRQHRPVTVTFNSNTTRCTVTWILDNGGTGTRVIELGSQNERFLFDNNPPAGSDPADNAFVFSPLGFISTIPGGNAPGNIYLRNETVNPSVGGNDRLLYQIQTTIAGGILLNRYDQANNVWSRAN